MHKVMYLVRRQDNVSPEEFRQNYRDHAKLVQQLPSVEHYHMNFPTAEAEAPYDAIVEVWVRDAGAFEQEMSGSAGQAVLDHGSTFVRMGEVVSISVDVEEAW
ncbi:MAG: EthD family reductase [Synechococcaceae cyanobacterium SM2_3_2]|nr:EthD family reductase [Synechococcaceae cyanobacterium SM2_3_2]